MSSPTPQTSQRSEPPVRRGPLAALWGAAMQRARPWVVLCRVHVREMNRSGIPSERYDGMTIRVATPDDLNRAADDMPGQLERQFIDRAMARGDICLAAFHDGAMVSFVWRSFTTAPHGDGLRVRVEWPYWYTYKAYTRPDFRGRRVSGLLTLYGDEVCRDRGYRYGVGFIETHNYASIRSNMRLGSKLVGYAGYVKLFGKVCPFRTPGVISHTFRFYRDTG